MLIRKLKSEDFLFLSNSQARKAVFRTFSIFWRDGDGDNAAIASDEDLAIALGEIEGPVYKLTVGVIEEKYNNESPVRSEDNEPIENKDSPVEDLKQCSGGFQ